MNIKEATEHIEGAVRAYLAKDQRGLPLIPFKMQRPLILLGPPGVGKTAVVEQIAARMGINFVSYSITHHTRQSALGLPFIAQETFDNKPYSVSEYTMSEIIAAVYHAQEATRVNEGILFLDEVNCVSETLAPAMLQFLQYKTFGMHKLPEGWIIICAGNPPEYNRAAREFDPAMLDRLMKIDIEPDIAVWQEYAVAHGVHPAITTYLEAKPSNFYNVRAAARGSKIVTCRGWEDLSRMLQAYEQLNMPVPFNLTERYLQDPEIAEDFAVYYELFNTYQANYSIASILDGAVADDAVEQARQARFDERMALVGILLDALLTRVHRVTELEEALKLVKKDVLSLKPQLEQAEDGNDLLREFIRKQNEQGLQPSLTAQLASDAAGVCAARFSVLNHIAETQKTGEGDAFELVRASFNGACSDMKAQASTCAENLSHALNFLDHAFGQQAQETVLFATKLAVDPAFVYFAIRHECPEWRTHNKNLLISERQTALLDEIAELLQ